MHAPAARKSHAERLGPAFRQVLHFLAPARSASQLASQTAEPLRAARRPTAMNIVDSRTIRGLRPGRSGLAAGVPAVVLLALATTFLAGCSAARPGLRLTVGTPSAAEVSLVRFNSCADALSHLRAAASRAIGAGGFTVGTRTSAPVASGPGRRPQRRDGSAELGFGRVGPGQRRSRRVLEHEHCHDRRGRARHREDRRTSDRHDHG